MWSKVEKKIIEICGDELPLSKVKALGILIAAMIFLSIGMLDSYSMFAVPGYILMLFLLIWQVEENEEIKAIAISAMYFYFVYSTYLGRDNWLGRAFYKIFMMSGLPLGWVLLVITIIFLGSIWFTLKKYISFKTAAWIFIFTLIFDFVVWYPLSFISYYNGVEGKLKDTSRLLLNATEKILDSDESSADKENKLREVYGSIGMQAKLFKNDKPWMETDAARFVIENPKGTNVVFDHEKVFYINNDVYKYSASNVYRPDIFTGVLRAFSWSVFPDRFGDDQNLEKMGIEASSNDIYRGRRKAGRSMNWWLIFSATFGLFASTICFWNKRELKLKQKVNEAEKTLYLQYKNAGLYQELLFSQLTKEFNDIMASQAKSHLQKYVASLGDGRTKKVLSEYGFEETMDSIKTSIGDRVHTLKNQWARSIEDDNGTQGEEIVQVILNDLRGLKAVFDVSYTNQKISAIEDVVRKSVPKQYSKIRSMEFMERHLEMDKFDDNLTVIVNLNRLKSIVENLLQNSRNATARFKLTVNSDSHYVCRLMLTTDIEWYKDKMYYTICVQDNGGGFSNPDIIYKEPVVSSDKSRGERMGAGTVYVDMFVKRMKGFIEASNEVYSDGYLGAKTKIFIPIKHE